MGEKACACVIPAKGKPLTFEEMVGFLKAKKIAPYKLPERLEIMDRFPLVPSGEKVDKKRLATEIAAKITAAAGARCG
jgi:non-ribosomal peptide synthetase component E (peptide arylation enzyme)